MILLGRDLGLDEDENMDYINALSPYVFEGEAVELTAQITATGSWEIIEGIEVSAGLGYIHVSNWRNQPGQSYDDLQFSLAVTVDVLPYALKLASLVLK